MNSNYMFDVLPDDANLIIREFVGGMLLSDRLAGYSDLESNEFFTSVIMGCNGDHGLGDPVGMWSESVYETFIEALEIFASMLGTHIFQSPQYHAYDSWMTGIQKSDEKIARDCFTGIIKRLVSKFAMMKNRECKTLKTYLAWRMSSYRCLVLSSDDFQIFLNTNDKWKADVISDLANLVDWSM